MLTAQKKPDALRVNGRVLPFVALGLLVCCAPVTCAAFTVEGRVLDDNGAVKDARVSAYRTYDDIRTGLPAAVSQPSDTQGMYRLEVPAGRYYFIARAERDGRKLFSYFGGNPARIESDRVWLGLMATEKRDARFADGNQAIKGVITYKGTPVGDAYVAVYRTDAKTFKGLGFKTESTGDDGNFSLSLPEGEYVLIARKSQAGGKIRPLEKGDLYCHYPGNPVEVRPGKTATVEIPCYPKAGRDTYSDTPFVRKDGYVIPRNLAGSSSRGVRGRVTDAAGNPLPGLYVLAYRVKSPVFHMYHLSNGTEFIGKTGDDGCYFIPVDEYEGDLHVVAMSSIGGVMPDRDSVFGLYEGSPDHAIRISRGRTVEGVDIVAGRGMFEGEGYDATAPTRAAGTVYAADAVIDRDMLWKGTVTIQGRISIKKGITLTIEPGTIVKFARVDRNGDGVGDGEILVEGRIVARGRPEKRIVFTSAEGRPRERDWSYILLWASGADNVFEYCRFHHAFSGVQVHHSRARIADCLFENNNEGVRFSRANLEMSHNTFRSNTIGFRFSRFEGSVAIRNNLVTANTYGFLFQRAHLNSPDFDKPQGRESSPLIRDNDIFGNREYNAKIGDRGALDIDVAGNWWGSAANDEVGRLFFDKTSDPELGLLRFEPCRKTPVGNAGIREREA